MKTEKMVHHTQMALPNSAAMKHEKIGELKSAYLEKQNEGRPVPRVGGPVSETGWAKTYESGDLPAAGGPVSEGTMIANASQTANDPWKFPDVPAFAVLQPEWIELSPYGDFPHARGLQRVDRAAAERIVAHYNSFWAKLGRKFAGTPVYIGHPDVPELANEFPDRKAYGWIAELQARAEGLYCRVKWSEAGRDLIANAHYKFYSPFWEAEPAGEASGKKVYRPVALISVGLTNQPNLPVQPLANNKSSESLVLSSELSGESPESLVLSSELENREDFNATAAKGAKVTERTAGTAVPTMPHFPLANEVLALQTLLMQRDERIQGMAQHLENARSDWATKQAQMEEEIGTLRRAVDRLEQSRIDVALEHALTQGRIAPAEREFWNSVLRQDFDARHEELKGRAEAIHMNSMTLDLRQNRAMDLANEETRGKVVKELMAAKMRFGMSYTEAWEAVKVERPDVFAAMNQGKP